jgi:hypothetical protein
VCGEAVAGRRRILSLVSVFITTSVERDRLLTGQIADYELTPWTKGLSSIQPTLYFSSVVSDAPHHLTAMYESLLQDVRDFRDSHGLSFHGGFAVASGAGGFRHMAKSGFRLLEGYKYRQKYDLMVIDAYTAANKFWRGLLNSETTFLRRVDPAKGVDAANLPSALESPFGGSTRAS